ncbi:MAG TPA: class II aldolase/adducin family protein [Steroidobacteraceae bacterium]|nr:class II aldolase/adducin family protein [Steroidobacteraceae bacterium]
MSVDSQDARAEVVVVAQALDAAGLMPNKSGNVSIRTPRGFAITPAATPYRELTAASLVELALAENGDTPNIVENADTPDFRAAKPGVSPFSRPSSEWRMHAAIYRAYPGVGAIVHTHSPRATALACAGLGIPPFHYMIALAGGEVRCMPYATFGTAELADSAVRGLEARRATLLANHGVVAVGHTLRAAHAVALEVENLAGQWLALRAAGLQPQLLDEVELARVIDKFAGYGRLG